MLAIYHSTVLRIVVRRLAQAIPILLLVSLLTFTLLNLLPGGSVAALLGTSATPALEHALSIRLGLNHPFWIRYFHWLRLAVFHADLGDSLVNNIPVVQTIGQRLPVSAELGGFAFVEALVFSIPIAVLVANKPRGVLDRVSMVVSIFGFSCPQFVTALVAIIVVAVKLRWLPATGFTPISQGLWPNIRSLILPASSIALGLFSGYTRILRGDMVDQLNGGDYIVTARAKGLKRWQILIAHAFRNSVFTLVTLAALNIGLLIGGAVIIEQVFGIPGMGLYLLSSIQSRDVVSVQAIVTIIAVAVVVANLIADLLYVFLDPRIRYGRATG